VRQFSRLLYDIKFYMISISYITPAIKMLKCTPAACHDIKSVTQSNWLWLPVKMTRTGRQTQSNQFDPASD